MLRFLDRQIEDALGERGFDLGLVYGVGEREAANERAALPFDAMILLSFLFAVPFLCAAYGEGAVFYRYFDIEVLQKVLNFRRCGLNKHVDLAMMQTSVLVSASG